MTDALSKPTLPTFSWVGQLKQDDRDLLSSYGEFFPAYPGTIIIEEGAMQTTLFVVVSGLLEVRAKQDDETEPLLARVGPGETLGEISLFHPGPAAATVRAIEFSQLWRIADADLIQFMEDNPGAGNVLLRTLASILAQRLRQMNPKAFGLSTYAVVESPDLKEEPPAPETPEVEAEKAAPPVAASATPPPPPAPINLEPLPKPLAPPTPNPTGIRGKRLSTKTQIVPDIDELEPI